MPALDVVLILGFAARLTRLVTVDTIGSPARDGLRWTGYAVAGTRGLAWGDELATCPHCIGFWLTAAVVATYVASVPTYAGWWRGVAGTFAASYIVGHLVARLDTGDDDG